MSCLEQYGPEHISLFHFILRFSVSLSPLPVPPHPLSTGREVLGGWVMLSFFNLPPPAGYVGGPQRFIIITIMWWRPLKVQLGSHL